MQNLFDMLKPGGDMLFILVANHLVFDIYESMAESKKWAPYSGDLYRHMTPYQHSLDAAKIMSEYLKKVGFADYKCQVVDRSFTYQNLSVFWSRCKIKFDCFEFIFDCFRVCLGCQSIS
jgi:hypothetical protein